MTSGFIPKEIETESWLAEARYNPSWENFSKLVDIFKNSRKWRIRRGVCVSLSYYGEIRSKKIWNFLSQVYLKDSSDKVRLAALEALSVIASGKKKLVNSLVRLIRYKNNYEFPEEPVCDGVYSLVVECACEDDLVGRFFEVQKELRQAR